MPHGLMWGKSTLGTLPFVYLGGQIAGATGVLVGQAVGGMIFALAAMTVAFRHISTLSNTHQITIDQQLATK